VKGHLGIDTENFVTFSADSQANLIVLCSNDGWIVTAYFPHSLDPHDGITAAGLRLADGGIPFQIGQSVVNGSLGRTFPPPTTNNRDFRPVLEDATRFVQPALGDLTVAVNELHVLDLGIDLAKPIEAGVTGSGRREWTREVEFDDLHAPRACH
jgi:hypothetical protein